LAGVLDLRAAADTMAARTSSFERFGLRPVYPAGRGCARSSAPGGRSLQLGESSVPPGTLVRSNGPLWSSRRRAGCRRSGGKSWLDIPAGPCSGAAEAVAPAARRARAHRLDFHGFQQEEHFGLRGIFHVPHGARCGPRHDQHARTCRTVVPVQPVARPGANLVVSGRQMAGTQRLVARAGRNPGGAVCVRKAGAAESTEVLPTNMPAAVQRLT
jgi:hypothetical protein